MAVFIAVIALLMVVVAVPLIVTKPHWVFYLFLSSTIFGTLFYGYIYAAGGLGTSRTWQPADLLAIETLIATFFVRREGPPVNSILRIFLKVLIALSMLSFIQGLIFSSKIFFLPDTRKLHFIIAMIFALKYLVNVDRVDKFLKFTTIILFVMFVGHFLLRIGIYVPPAAIQRAGGQLAGERGELAFVPFAYLALLSIGLAGLGNRIGSKFRTAAMILVALAGLSLAESRTIQGAAVFMGFLASLFSRGRFKNIAMFSLAAVIIVIIASNAGFDPFDRWRITSSTEGGTHVDLWRAAEYSIIVQSYAAQPYLLITGRGLGAVHTVPIPSEEALSRYVSYYHSEFLGWLDLFGMAGLISILAVWLISILQSFKLIFCEIPVLKYYGTIVFLLLPVMFLHSIFSPCFMHERGAPLLICFIVIIANCNEIYRNLYSDDECMTDLCQEEHLSYEN